MPYNVSRHLRTVSNEHPERTAVVLASGKTISFAQLDAECDRFANHFKWSGITESMRVIVLVKPGFEFVPTIFGLFRLGAIPVCIDPGMKLKNMLACIREASPQALVGIRLALWAARLFPKAFASVKVRCSVPNIIPGSFQKTEPIARQTNQHDPAAVLFTSGSTGIPKGVVYTHGAFDGQQEALRKAYAINENEVDLVVFPLFALFSAAWGITAVIPRMNPARPARTSGRHLADLVNRYGVTHAAGSPAIWKNLAEHCEKYSLRLPTLKRLLMAGAQVPEKLVRTCAKLAQSVHTPYGSTEALPLTTVCEQALFESYAKTRLGAGTCVGKPLPGVEIAILPFVEGPIKEWDDTQRQPPLIKGEIAVRAPWVTQEYFRKPEATACAKISSPQGVWHRMGDVGYLDNAGNLWFCGRKDHRIFFSNITLYPDPVEAIFDSHPAVKRSAVVGVGPRGNQRPILVVQGTRGLKRSASDLRTYADKFPSARALQGIVFRKHFPVDVRHNIKIDRLKLARQIEGKVT